MKVSLLSPPMTSMFHVRCLQHFLVFSSVALVMRKTENPFKMATMGKRTSMVALSPLSERSLPQIRVSNWRRMKRELPSTMLSSVLFLLCPPPQYRNYSTPYTVSCQSSRWKKRAMAVSESDEDDVFVPRYDTLSLCYFQNIVC